MQPIINVLKTVHIQANMFVCEKSSIEENPPTEKSYNGG